MNEQQQIRYTALIDAWAILLARSEEKDMLPAKVLEEIGKLSDELLSEAVSLKKRCERLVHHLQVEHQEAFVHE